MKPCWKCRGRYDYAVHERCPYCAADLVDLGGKFAPPEDWFADNPALIDRLATLAVKS